MQAQARTRTRAARAGASGELHDCILCASRSGF